MKTTDNSRYKARGVSSSKSGVHAAIEGLDEGLFPGAFCKVLPDYLSGDPNHCLVHHADGAGTKAGLAYLAYRKTGELTPLRRVAQDSVVMNIDDLACVGATGPFVVSGTIGRNAARVNDDAIAAVIQGTEEFLATLQEHGIDAYSAGGETADLGDLVRTLVVDHTVTARMHRDDVIHALHIKAPAYIVGFSSTGQALWENEPNSGMGSNGLTNARHDVLSPHYRKYIETYAPETSPDLIYCGSHSLTETLPGDPCFTIESALLSPTRTYVPLIKRLLSEVGREHFMGLIHCSGGGQTKIGNFGCDDILYRKDNLFAVPPLFKMLQEVRSLPWKEMYQTYNMGHRLEAVVADKAIAHDCVDIAQMCGINAQIVGEVLYRPRNRSKRAVSIIDPHGEHLYSFS